MTLAAKIGDARWQLAQEIGQGTPKAFVALLVFWLALLFASFRLFAPRNLTSAVTLTMCSMRSDANSFRRLLCSTPKHSFARRRGEEISDFRKDRQKP
jgi:hypothetical protein